MKRDSRYPYYYVGFHNEPKEWFIGPIGNILEELKTQIVDRFVIHSFMCLLEALFVISFEHIGVLIVAAIEW